MAPLQSGNPRTRPPVYTARVKAYLTSELTHAKGKAPTKQQLEKPPKLPERADPASEEARLLGRLHPRREANIKWRYLSDMRSRLLPPQDPREVAKLEEKARSFKLPGSFHNPIPLASELQERFKENERRWRSARAWQRPRRITSRFMRRRYYDLLAKAIILDAEAKPNQDVKWEVKQPEGRREVARRMTAAKADYEWL